MFGIELDRADFEQFPPEAQRAIRQLVAEVERLKTEKNRVHVDLHREMSNNFRVIIDSLNRENSELKNRVRALEETLTMIRNDP